MAPESIDPGLEPRLSRRSAEDYCDRILVLSGCLAVVGLLCVLAFGFLRGSDRVGATYNTLKVAVGALVLLVILFLVFRRRVYGRLKASRLTMLLIGFVAPVVAIELYANIVNLKGYHYFAQTERYFQWQNWEGTPLSHEHPTRSELDYPWGKIVTNSEGWRGPEPALEPAADPLRLLALGASVVFSWDVDERQTITAAIERALAEDQTLARKYRRVEVINTGNCSFNSVD